MSKIKFYISSRASFQNQDRKTYGKEDNLHSNFPSQRIHIRNNMMIKSYFFIFNKSAVIVTSTML